MREFSLSYGDAYTEYPDKRILKEAIITFMIEHKTSIEEKYFMDDKCYQFKSGIPYGFFGKLNIYSAKDDPKEFQILLQDKYALFVEDRDSFVAKFLRRVEKYIDGKDRINIMEYIVPECYPPRFIDDF